MTAEEAREVAPAAALLWVTGHLRLSAPLWEPPVRVVQQTVASAGDAQDAILTYKVSMQAKLLRRESLPCSVCSQGEQSVTWSSVPMARG